MQMTITRGLAELKTLDSRIENAIAGGCFVSIVKGNKQIPLSHTKTAEQLSTDINASYQSVNKLIKRRDDIKRAIIRSNAVTTVSIGGEEMTIAEAIERKTSINYKTKFLGTLRQQYSSNSGVLQMQNTRVDADIEKRVMAIYGNEKGKVTADQHEIIAKSIKDDSWASLLDPAGIEKRIESLKTEIEDFITEVDFSLSESNAKTTIEVAD